MDRTFRFPNGGYDVKVYRKKDIIDCIDANIIDKDVALELVKQCEIDASNFFIEGRWTGLPFVGNIRIPAYKRIMNSEDTLETLDDAKNSLSKEKYVLFRKNLSIDVSKQIKQERYYKYVLTKSVSNNQQEFRRISKLKGDFYAKVLFFTLYEMTNSSET